MEIKKSPKADLEGGKGLSLLMLVIMCAAYLGKMARNISRSTQGPIFRCLRERRRRHCRRIALVWFIGLNPTS